MYLDEGTPSKYPAIDPMKILPICSPHDVVMIILYIFRATAGKCIRMSRTGDIGFMSVHVCVRPEYGWYFVCVTRPKPLHIFAHTWCQSIVQSLWMCNIPFILTLTSFQIQDKACFI